MNKEFLSKMAMAELKALARNRGIEIKARSPKYTIIQKILSYDKKNHYKKLGFDSFINEWRKEELVIELKALGNKSGNLRTKKDIVYALQNKGKFPMKNTKKNSSKYANKKNDENKNNKNKKMTKKNPPKRKSKLKQKEDNFMKAFGGLETLILNVFRDLQDGFKPVDEKKKLPHSYKDWQNKMVISEDLGDLLDGFGDKILQLLPLILEIKSITNDFNKYKQKLIKYKVNKNKSKKTYFLGMKKYKKKKDYNNDEIGPICGVFDSIKKFEEWKNDKKVKKMYGKNIFRARYVKTNKENDNDDKNKNDDIDESESEIEMESEQEEDESLSDESQQDSDDMIPSEEDQDIANNNYNTSNNVDNDEQDDVAEIVITTTKYNNNHNHNGTTQDEDEDDQNEDDQDEDGVDEDEEDDDNDNDIDMNKNKETSRTITKKPAMTKNTRSRREAATKKKKVSGRKRRRSNDPDTDHDDEDDVEPNRKRMKLTKSTKKKTV